MYFVFILQHHLLKTYSLLLLVPRAMHLHPPAHPGIVSDALAERIAVEEPGMTATDQVSEKSSAKMFFIPFGCPTTVPPAVQRTTAQFSELKRSDNSLFLSSDPGLFQRDKLKSCGERVCESEADSSALPQLGSPLSEDPLLRQKSDVSGWLCMRRL